MADRGDNRADTVPDLEPPGPTPHHREDGSFRAGNSANPLGRPKKTPLQVFLSELTKDARYEQDTERRTIMYQALFEIGQQTGDLKAANKAIETLMAYDEGKPRQQIELTGAGGGDLLPPDPISKMTSGQRRQRMAELLAKAQAQGDPPDGGDGG